MLLLPNQTEFWQLFQLPSKGNYIRKCLAALTFQNAFLNHNKNIRSHKIVDQLNELVNQELDSIRRNFLNQLEFEKQSEHWRKRWKISSHTLWNKKHNSVSFVPLTIAD